MSNKLKIYIGMLEKNHCGTVYHYKCRKLFTRSQTWEIEQPHYRQAVEYYAAVKKKVNTPPTKTHVVMSQNGTEGGKRAKKVY